ncbi:hypothetical protein [Escherichia coli]|uniref:hypothetical protein n=1 Tax=Escherichia coli TaxID=562 RepID=UPI000A385042|nr:hypothetical protein [Escherichia coli]
MKTQKMGANGTKKETWKIAQKKQTVANDRQQTPANRKKTTKNPDGNTSASRKWTAQTRNRKTRRPPEQVITPTTKSTAKRMRMTLNIQNKKRRKTEKEHN